MVFLQSLSSQSHGLSKARIAPFINRFNINLCLCDIYRDELQNVSMETVGL